MYSTAKKIVDEGIESIGRYYSIYRAIVVDNEDNEKHLNRIKVCVPEVMGGVINWAYPKNQHGSQDCGFKHLAPKIGDIVFITFEYGDPTKPLWEYHGWGLNQIPSVLDGPNKMGLVTPEGNVIVIDDDNGDLTLNFNGVIAVGSDGNIVIHSKRVFNIGAGDSIILNKGENGGLINITELTEKLNTTIRELESLRNRFNTHTHPGVTSGGSTTAPTLNQVLSPFSTYNRDEYEDKDCIH